MKELLIAIASGLVENPDAVNVTVDEANEEGVIVYHIQVAPEDMGRVRQPTFCEPPLRPKPPVKRP